MKSIKLIKKSNNIANKNIALIGHMGSGKSIIGRLLAKKLDIPHLDSDNLLEKKYNKTIKEIYEEGGELNFRKIEEKAILEIDLQNSLVLSLGGGSVIIDKIRKLLKEEFITVFLDVKISKLFERLNKSTKRPLLLGQDIEKKLKELDLIRRKYYLLADIKISNINNPEVSVSEILNKIKKFL